MKLYAKVNSERASKGQGGNKEIVIDLLIDPVKRLEIGRVVMKFEEDVYTVYYYPINENCTDQKINSGRVLLYETKGNTKYCTVCGEKTFGTGFENGVCDRCWEKEKGNNQKGDIFLPVGHDGLYYKKKKN